MTLRVFQRKHRANDFFGELWYPLDWEATTGRSPDLVAEIKTLLRDHFVAQQGRLFGEIVFAFQFPEEEKKGTRLAKN